MIIADIVHFLHVGAAILWVGGVAFFYLTLIPVLRPNLEPALRLKIMSESGKRFKWVSLGSILVLLITGAMNTLYAAAENPPPVFWKILGLKIFLVFLVIVMSGVHDLVWGPRLVAPRQGDDSTALRRKVHLLARTHFATLIIIVLLGVILANLK